MQCGILHTGCTYFRPVPRESNQFVQNNQGIPLSEWYLTTALILDPGFPQNNKIKTNCSLGAKQLSHSQKYSNINIHYT